ncbi:MAG: hypothetical protein AMS23_04905 [Bacteroides sp. SM1_62]|nr:MAG: hypothetical protein AMS26_03815 [Bacteroides sp. SM23_62]KPL25521.1 MAG: hypothetical protein AMS23_04905 [Bacteroides sp. SM1_62]
MNRYKIILLVLALLVAVSAWLFLSRRSGTYARSDVEFAVKDTGRITGVEIKGRGGQVMLVRHEDAWRVNGSTPVRKDRMSGLLVLLSRLEVLSPVSRSRSEEVSMQLQQDGKRVIITLDKGAAREYFVCHDTTGTDATYMMLKDADTPFRMGVRGFNPRDLAALYATDERYWRDNLLLHFLPAQIECISLQYNRDPARTFHLARNEEGEFEMSAGTVPGEWFTPVTAKLNQYLGYFYGVRFDAYADLQKDMPLNYTHSDEPDYVLEVSSTRGTRTILRLFPVFARDTAGNKKMDLNRLYAKVDDWDEMVVLKYLEIDPLLKEPGYFQSK